MDLELLDTDDAKTLFNRFSLLLRACTNDKMKKALEKSYMKCVGDLCKRDNVSPFENPNQSSSRKPKVKIQTPILMDDSPSNQNKGTVDISRTPKYDRPKGKMTAKEFGALNDRLNEDLELRNQFFANNNKKTNLFQGHLGDNHEQINLFAGRQFNINEFNNIFENIQDHSLRETVDYHDVTAHDFYGSSLNPQAIVEYGGVMIEDTRNQDSAPIGIALSNEKMKELMKTTPKERKKGSITVQDRTDDMSSFYSRKTNNVKSDLEESRAYIEANRHLYGDGGAFNDSNLNDLIAGVVNRF